MRRRCSCRFWTVCCILHNGQKEGVFRNYRHQHICRCKVFCCWFPCIFSSPLSYTTNKCIMSKLCFMQLKKTHLVSKNVESVRSSARLKLNRVLLVWKTEKVSLFSTLRSLFCSHLISIHEGCWLKKHSFWNLVFQQIWYKVSRNVSPITYILFLLHQEVNFEYKNSSERFLEPK